eukprot:TRINITY_DN18645_c1_g4_i1.p1 TRINITY_DN18645_c1_g4~~TRINITY_DN18645_c1_g4_i1.p1  ORF type:complete len:155 (+),score=22.45 TRINITY_DN18645_c1_g4_i1:93-557(+)
MWAGIEVCGPGVDFREIGKAISAVAKEGGYWCSENLVGHGIGSYFHGMPEINPALNDNDQGLMKPGMTFTVEPVFVQRIDGKVDRKAIVDAVDGWTLSTGGAWSAQFEHTVLITETGHDVLTGPSVDYVQFLREKIASSKTSAKRSSDKIKKPQ